jgi:hypothetical protein
MSQSPDPVQSTVESGPTSTRQLPEPVQLVVQLPGQSKSQLPAPAHCSWHSDTQ